MTKSAMQAIWCALLTLCLAGCQNERIGTTDQKPTRTSNSKNAKVTQAIKPATTQDQDCRAALKFIAATVYAGATDYYFDTSHRNEVVYRVENDGAQPKGFEKLTVRGKEGPPETNPEMIGKEFRVCQHKGVISLDTME